MTSTILAFGTLVVVGIIVADILIHPKGTSVVLSGLGNLSKTAGNQMLGYRAK